MNKVILQIRNIGLWLNNGVCAFIGKDPRMTISAVAYLHKVRWLVWLSNTLYRDPDHCKTAATGWDTPEWRESDRSLWKHGP
jgi:hypothetical protein